MYVKNSSEKNHLLRVIINRLKVLMSSNASSFDFIQMLHDTHTHSRLLEHRGTYLTQMFYDVPLSVICDVRQIKSNNSDRLELV